MDLLESGQQYAGSRNIYPFKGRVTERESDHV